MASIVRLTYPHLGNYKCPFVQMGTCMANFKKGGIYQTPPGLVDHLKKCHPAASLKWRCRKCNFKDSGRYAYRTVGIHFADSHSSEPIPQVVDSTLATLKK